MRQAASTPGERVFVRRAPYPDLTVDRCPGWYEVEVPGLAQYRVSFDGNSVGIASLGAEEDAAFRGYERFVLPLIGQLRGTPSLHASGFVAGGRGVGLLGPSRAGKSTLAASAARCRPLLGDDFLELSCDGVRIFTAPSESRIRLWPDSLRYFGGDLATQDAFGKGLLARVPNLAAVELGRIYVLDGKAEETVAIERLRPRDALLTLASHCYRIDPTDRELLSRELQFLERVVSCVPVARLRYPRDFARISEVERAIDVDLASAA